VKRRPWYFAYDDIPVKVVDTPEGGMDVQALNPRTGEFVQAWHLLDAYMRISPAIDELTERQFQLRVAKIRRELRGG
jgi:hypothetical protein